MPDRDARRSRSRSTDDRHGLGHRHDPARPPRRRGAARRHRPLRRHRAPVQPPDGAGLPRLRLPGRGHGRSGRAALRAPGVARRRRRRGVRGPRPDRGGRRRRARPAAGVGGRHRRLAPPRHRRAPRCSPTCAPAASPGALYVVHPEADEIGGLPASPQHRRGARARSTSPSSPCRAPAVPAVARECGAAGVRALVVLSAGFAEVGARRRRAAGRAARGLPRRRDAAGRARTASASSTRAEVGLNATFAPEPPRPGRIAFASQSGAFGIAAIAEAARRGLGLSSFVSTGDKADLSGNDFLRYWEQDADTDVVLLYLESFGNPRRFGRIARAVAARKPIVAVKSGRSAAGARAAASHTGALLAASDVTVDALFAPCRRDPHGHRRRAARRRGAARRPAAAARRPGRDRHQRRRARHRLRGRLRGGRPAGRAASRSPRAGRLRPAPARSRRGRQPGRHDRLGLARRLPAHDRARRGRARTSTP